jgi:hypothetical protein
MTGPATSSASRTVESGGGKVQAAVGSGPRSVARNQPGLRREPARDREIASLNGCMIGATTPSGPVAVNDMQAGSLRAKLVSSCECLRGTPLVRLTGRPPAALPEKPRPIAETWLNRPHNSPTRRQRAGRGERYAALMASFAPPLQATYEPFANRIPSQPEWQILRSSECSTSSAASGDL